MLMVPQLENYTKYAAALQDPTFQPDLQKYLAATMTVMKEKEKEKEKEREREINVCFFLIFKLNLERKRKWSIFCDGFAFPFRSSPSTFTKI